jgi:E3 ubiquitin-protein ligase TRIP12
MDISEQFMAAQELSDLLAVATEETIGPGSGSGFQPDLIVPPLVNILQNGSTFDLPGELQLLCCRCLSNMLEALPIPAVHSAMVSSELIPALCSKLMAIEYIDVAEQAIALLEKLSHDHAREILKANGMELLLSFIDFFNISTQRTAVQCAANAMRSLSVETIAQCRAVIPVLSRLLQYSDQRVVEAACLSFTNMVESWTRLDSLRKRKNDTTKDSNDNSSTLLDLDILVNENVLKNILQLLEMADAKSGSASTATISPSTFFGLLRMLKLIAQASDKLTGNILRLGAADVMKRIITGSVGDTKDDDEMASNASQDIEPELATSDSSMVSRPAEQWLAILELIVALVPETEMDKRVGDGRNLLASWKLSRKGSSADAIESDQTTSLEFPLLLPTSIQTTSSPSPYLPAYCSAVLPLVIDVFQASVNESVRIKCLIATFRMVFYLDSNLLHDAVQHVPLASFLARVIGRCLPRPDKSGSKTLNSQGLGSTRRTSPPVILSMLTYALGLCELLLRKLPSRYSIFLRREGAIYEIERIRSIFALSSDLNKRMKSLRQRVTELDKMLKTKQGLLQSSPLAASSSEEGKNDSSGETMNDETGDEKNESKSSTEKPAASVSGTMSVEAALTTFTNQTSLYKELSKALESYDNLLEEWYREKLGDYAKKFVDEYVVRFANVTLL